MPASYDDLCQCYESCVKNIHDSIYTLESFIGNNTAYGNHNIAKRNFPNAKTHEASNW